MHFAFFTLRLERCRRSAASTRTAAKLLNPRQRCRSLIMLRSVYDARPDAYRCDAVPIGLAAYEIAAGRTGFLSLSSTWQFPKTDTLG